MKLNAYFYKFEHVSSFGEFTAALTPMAKANDASECQLDERWDYGMSWDESLKLAKSGGGWSEGARNLKDVKLPESHVQRLNESLTLECSPVGFMPIVANYLTNTPDSMLTYELQESPKKIISIMVNMAIPCSVDAADLLNRGRAILAAIDALQNQGYECELWASVGAKFGEESIETLICIKQAGELYDLAKVAFCLCSVALFRRLFLRFLEAHETLYLATLEAYGTPLTANTPLDCDVNIPPIEYQCQDYDTPTRALETIQGIFASQLKK